jgi:hypothetical protein
LSAAYRAAGLRFGVGLSPLEIWLDDGPAARGALTDKIRMLNDAGVDILCLLFDDMKGDVPGLAQLQADIAHTAAEATTATRFILCPTYYSDDPVLARVFGAMPAGYLEELGRRLDPAIDIFWTGPRVVSKDYPADHLARVAERLQRKPFLWDNYPVNDGARMSKHLHLRAVANRPARLRDQLAGHAVNPMNQPWLSRLPLATLAASYAEGDAYDPERAFARAADAQCGPALAAALTEDLPCLDDGGLDALGETEKKALAAKYAAFTDDPFAAEVVGFLTGAYEFDPACLTD